MAILPERTNSLVLARDFRDKLTRRTGITDFDADSKTDTLISVFVDQVLAARNDANKAFYANQISTAKGQQLDQLGQDMGLPRFAETYSFSEKRDQNVAFYVSSGDFGSVNASADISIPAGTEIFSNENENDLGASIRYRTTADVTLFASRSVGFVPVRAVASGNNSNLGGGMLINHSFSSYSAGTGLLVTNFYSILNGRPREHDRNYRFRLSRRYDTLASSNNSKLHLQSLRVPGVLDTRIINGYFGVGTVGVVVVGPENQSNNNTIRGVQARLNEIQGPGALLRAVAPTSVFLDIEMEVATTSSLTTSQKRQFELSVRRGLRNHFRSQGIGGTIDLKAATRELSVYAGGTIRFTNLGKPEQVFETVYIRKGPSSGLTTERDILENSYYSMDEDEYADLGTLSIRYT